LESFDFKEVVHQARKASATNTSRELTARLVANKLLVNVPHALHCELIKLHKVFFTENVPHNAETKLSKNL